ncbi:MAG: LamG-like jellyroll fold domain-containing protein [Candidatus Paceibacterota bacterium]|jgi:hypothetical protein
MSLINKYSTPAERLRQLTFADKFESASKVRENRGVITGCSFDNNGVTFNGVTEYISYPYQIQHSISDALTVIIDVKNLTMLSGAWQVLICAASGAAIVWQVGIDNTASTTAKYPTFYNGTTATKSSVTANLNGNHLIAISISGGTCTFYIDGVQLGITRAITYGAATVSQIIIGSQLGYTQFSNATIRNIKIFKAALSSQEIKDFYDNSTYYYESKTYLDLPMLMADHDGINFTTKDHSANGVQMLLGGGTPGYRPTKLTKRGYLFATNKEISTAASYNSRPFFVNTGGTYEVFIKRTGYTNSAVLLNVGACSIGQALTTGLLRFSGGASVYKTSAESPPPNSVFHFVASFTCDGSYNGTVILYLNGVSILSTTYTLSSVDSGFLRLGSAGAALGLSGEYYRARIWRFPLTSTQVKDAYLKGLESINAI